MHKNYEAFDIRWANEREQVPVMFGKRPVYTSARNTKKARAIITNFLEKNGIVLEGSLHVGEMVGNPGDNYFMIR